MNPLSTDPSSAAAPTVPPVHGIAVRSPRASSVIVHHVPADAVEPFMEWQRGILAAAESFPGYQGTDIYPPTDGQHTEWVVVIHFDNSEELQRWLGSPVRAEWVARLPAAVKEFQLKTLPTGFGPWFAGLAEGGKGQVLPAWKMVAMVLLGLYPTVMLLSLFLSPHLSALGFAGSMLVSNAISSCLLQWAVVPVLQRVARPWLYPAKGRGLAFSAGGLVLILLLLAVLALLFRQVMG
jgi:antibiotic biosynthesis monooxygenase (ABM) superfamily enzyme